MAEHFLNASEVSSSLDQVSGERVAEQVRVHAFRLQTGLLGQAPQDQEGSGPRQRPSLCVEEQLRPVPAVEVRASAGEVTAECLHGLTTDRDDTLLAALSNRSDEPLFQVPACSIQSDRLADPEARAVEELDERLVA